MKEEKKRNLPSGSAAAESDTAWPYFELLSFLRPTLDKKPLVVCEKFLINFKFVFTFFLEPAQMWYQPAQKNLCL